MPAGVTPAVADCTRDWRRLQMQKWRLRGGVEARMLLALGMYFGEQGMVQARDAIVQRGTTVTDDNNRLFLVFNMLKKLAKRRMGRIWSVSPEFGASPNKIDPAAFDNADVVNDLIRGTDHKLREKLLHWQRVWWLVTTGVCVEHTPWVEDVAEEPLPAIDPETGELLWKEAQTGKIIPQSFVERLIKEAGIAPERFSPVEHLVTVGEVGAQILSGFNFFIDHATTSVKDIPPGARCYIAECKSVAWIKDIFGAEIAKQVRSSPGDDVAILKTKLLDRGTALASMNMRDLLPAVQGSRAPDDPPMAIVCTAYEPASQQYPHGRRHIFIPNQITLDDAACQYGEIPITDFHYEAPTTSFWTGDFLTDLIPAQKFLNKRMSQMGEAANASIHEVLLLGSELTREDIPTDIPGVVKDGLDENGNPRVKAMERSQLPGWFLESIRDIVSFLQDVGGSDITQRKAQFGQMRGPLALPMLQELLDSEDGPFFSHLGEQLALVKQQRVNRVKQFYPPVRTLNYTGKNNKDEVFVFHTSKVLRSGTDYTIKVDQQSLLPELGVIRRARVIEDLSGPAAILYTDPRTGKLDATKIAMAMKYTDVGIEDRQVQTRKLAQHLIARLWQAEALPDEVPYPFWDHGVVLDELYSAMVTTEWLEASSQVKQNFIAFYERTRNYLAAIQQSQMDAVQSQMVQGAVAQATQQAAAKATSIAVDTAVGQIQEQARAASVMGPDERLMAASNQSATIQ